MRGAIPRERWGGWFVACASADLRWYYQTWRPVRWLTLWYNCSLINLPADQEWMRVGRWCGDWCVFFKWRLDALARLRCCETTTDPVERRTVKVTGAAGWSGTRRMNGLRFVWYSFIPVWLFPQAWPGLALALIGHGRRPEPVLVAYQSCVSAIMKAGREPRRFWSYCDAEWLWAVWLNVWYNCTRPILKWCWIATHFTLTGTLIFGWLKPCSRLKRASFWSACRADLVLYQSCIFATSTHDRPWSCVCCVFFSCRRRSEIPCITSCLDSDATLNPPWKADRSLIHLIRFSSGMLICWHCSATHSGTNQSLTAFWVLSWSGVICLMMR